MSWGTYYVKTDGYVSRQGAASAGSDAEDRRVWLERLWQRILILMSSAPHSVKDEDGHSVEWVDYIQKEYQDIKEQMEEYYGEIHRLEDVSEAYEQGHVVISYCKNGHAHFRSVEYQDHGAARCSDCGAEIIGCCRMNVCKEG